MSGYRKWFTKYCTGELEHEELKRAGSLPKYLGPLLRLLMKEIWRERGHYKEDDRDETVVRDDPLGAWHVEIPVVLDWVLNHEIQAEEREGRRFGLREVTCPHDYLSTPDQQCQVVRKMFMAEFYHPDMDSVEFAQLLKGWIKTLDRIMPPGSFRQIERFKDCMNRYWYRLEKIRLEQQRKMCA